MRQSVRSGRRRTRRGCAGGWAEQSEAGGVVLERGKGVGEKVNRGRPRRAGGLRALSRSEEAQRGRSKGGLGGMTRRRRGKAKAEQAARGVRAGQKEE